MLPHRTDVLVVGAGPTGLALAAALQQAGVDHVVIDKLEVGHNMSRAAVVHAHTLEALDRIGVAASLRAEGLPLQTFTVRDRDRALLQVGFEALPSHYRDILMVPQNVTEAVLHDRLLELGGCVHAGVTAIRAKARKDGALVTVATKAGEHSLQARYVVGGDGMHSIVRSAAKIGFDGTTYGESFMLADVEMDWPLGAAEVSLFFSPSGLVVVAPLPGGTFRIVATIDEAPETPTLTDVQRLLDARGPAKRPAAVKTVLWGSRFRVHHRLASSYRAGPFLLMGDAAHVHSPAGGQGMNTGLVDAIVLGEALARAVRNKEPDTILDAYADVRRPAARQVLALATRLTRIATVRAPALRILRNSMLRLLNHLPPLKRALALGLSGLSRRKLSILPSGVNEDADQALTAREKRRRHPAMVPEGRPAPLIRPLPARASCRSQAVPA
jgi:2-polyprenyl-6-methoxyphenol hydroxylase-like FAD-dependent oxidoreductase